MPTFGGLLGVGRSKGHGQRSLNALDELTQIQDAMAAVTYIMADDVDGAEEHLNKGSSPFHQLGKGVVTFMRATLGFEQDIMREASNVLSDAENSAYEQQRRATRATSSYQSPIYPPGTEYAVCQAQAQLMSAIVGVLNESLTEAIKSFYKLRKAFITLEGIMEAEKKYLKERSTSSLATTGSDKPSNPVSRTALKGPDPSVNKSASPEHAPAQSRTSLSKETQVQDIDRRKEAAEKGPDDEEFEFVDADEAHPNLATPMEYMGHLGVPTEEGEIIAMNNDKRDTHIEASSAPGLPSDPTPDTSVPDVVEDFEKLTTSNTIQNGEDITLFSDHPIDTFIISGSNFCFGILLLIMSMVPPAFGTLLKIVGFKGDRERGIQLLWQATKFDNIHGAMAGFVLSGFYNGLHGFCDITPQNGPGSWPKVRCATLLTEMRKRYPKSHLWMIEEARTFAQEKQLEKSVEYMKNMSESPLKQLEALQWFERSLDTMYLHDYEGTSFAFQKCITLNSWSHGLYYYICGSAHVELYRKAKAASDDAEAATQQAKAKELFAKVAPNTGRKKFMARQLPFDVFVNRKIMKWEARAKEWGCDLIDAVGISPIEEMIYFWNGHKKMRNDHLQVSLETLAWSESAQNPYWEKESLDEKGILSLLRGAVFRNMGDTSKSRDLLDKEILSVDKTLYRGHLKDTWPAPCARYEMAANAWKEADVDAKPEEHMDKLTECKTWLEEVSRWESYDLDARIGMKVTTAKGTLRRYGIQIS